MGQKFLIGIVLILGGMAGVPSGGNANPIEVSDVTKEKGFFIVTFNKSLVIGGIRVRGDNGRIYLDFPQYKSRQGKVYPQVKILSKDLYQKIVKSLHNKNVVKPVGKNDLSFTIEEPHFSKRPNSRANVAVIFNRSIVINFGVFQRIKNGKKAYWIGYPGHQINPHGPYQECVVITDDKLKTEVEEALILKFQRALSELGVGGK